MIRSRLIVASIVVVGLSAGSCLDAVAASSESGGDHGAASRADEEPSVDAGHGDPGHGEGHEASTNPLTVDPDLAIFTGILFLILLAVLWKFAWGPIAEALDRREQGIAGQIEEARRNTEEAKRLLAEHQARLDGAADEVRGLLDQARREAETQKQQIVAEAQQAAQAEKDRAVREIGAAKNQALRDLAEKSVNTAVDLAGRIVRRQLKPEDHADLIRETLPQLTRDS
jgi:F-type H+-transporting ATPase subunit b